MLDESLVVCSEVPVGHILTYAHFVPFSTNTLLTKKRQTWIAGKNTFFFGIHWCAEIEGNIPGIRPVCLFFS
jgi:hypothetical protein